jgi:hypothetical protein
MRVGLERSQYLVVTPDVLKGAGGLAIVTLIAGR